MIKKLQIQNFKCFQKPAPFEFSGINLLTGVNGRGKSSLLQSILLISQSVNRHHKLKKLKLNGPHVNLGNFDDVKNSETLRGGLISYTIEFIDPEVTMSFSFKENEADQLTALLEGDLSITLSEAASEEIKAFEKQLETFIGSLGPEAIKSAQATLGLEDTIVANLLSKVHYVSADRLGPVKYIEKRELPEFVNVGSHGENTILILAKDDLPLVNEKLYMGKNAKTVVQQTEEWLSYILDGAKLEIKGREKESSVLYMLLNNKNNSYSYKPSNIGFGYSYILPLIVSGLIAKKGDILIIENPEAHLHPRAQAKITEFFARVGSCGVQVFIESHSEHILNGLRVSSITPEIDITNNDLTIHYFDENFEFRRLKSNSKGKIENWPQGFFDQQEIDLAKIYEHNK